MNSVFACSHLPKKFKLLIDGGLGETLCLELCKLCHLQQKPKFVIKVEIL